MFGQPSHYCQEQELKEKMFGFKQRKAEIQRKKKHCNLKASKPLDMYGK